MMGGGGASPYDLPERVALDALASLARRVGASAVRLLTPASTSVLALALSWSPGSSQSKPKCLVSSKRSSS
jgi:hypothetical protein